MTGFGPVQPKVCGTGRVESPGKVPIPLSSKYTWVYYVMYVVLSERGCSATRWASPTRGT